MTPANRGLPRTAGWGYPEPYTRDLMKVLRSERFDLLGNSLAVLAGIAAPSRAKALVRWVEAECGALRACEDLAPDLPPCLFPYYRPGDPDWRPRYADYNRPGEYHNGGIWPFVCGFYVAALVAAGRPTLAARRLISLTELVRPARRSGPPSVPTSGTGPRTGPRRGRTGRLGRRRCISTPPAAWKIVVPPSSTLSDRDRGSMKGGLRASLTRSDESL